MVKKLTIGSLKKGQRLEQTIENVSTVEPISNHDETNEEYIEVEQHQSSFKIKPEQNQTILDAAFDQNIELDYKCRRGTCGRCRVKVKDGGELIGEINEKERIKLEEQTQQGFRLACQATFK